VSGTSDTLTGSVWGDRVVMTAFGLVFGVLFIRSALDPGPAGVNGVDWRGVGIAAVSVAFWAALVLVVAPALGVGGWLP